jgi:hypothetical protein
MLGYVNDRKHIPELQHNTTQQQETTQIIFRDRGHNRLKLSEKRVSFAISYVQAFCKTLAEITGLDKCTAAAMGNERTQRSDRASPASTASTRAFNQPRWSNRMAVRYIFSIDSLTENQRKCKQLQEYRKFEDDNALLGPCAANKERYIGRTCAACGTPCWDMSTIENTPQNCNTIPRNNRTQRR